MTRTEGSRFTGEVAFVTGAGSGIGRATALAFAAEGAAVAVAGIPESDIAETARLIEQDGGRALARTCDVTRQAGYAAARSGAARMRSSKRAATVSTCRVNAAASSSVSEPKW